MLESAAAAAGKFRINRATLSAFTFCQIVAVLLFAPLVTIPGGSSNVGDEFDVLRTILNQTFPQDVTEQTERLHASFPYSKNEHNGCHHRLYRSSDFNPNKMFAGTKIFHPPPVPFQAFNHTIDSVQLGIEPRYGRHQCHNNAILSFVYGYQLPQIIYFVSTLLHSGFHGDLVLGVTPNLTIDTRDFLEYLTDATSETKLNVVIYEIDLACSKRGSQFLCQSNKMFRDASSMQWISDFRPLRRVATLRFEFYWAWTSLYSSNSELFLTDARDVYFQGNPIPNDDDGKVRDNDTSNSRTLVLFEEAATIEQSRANSNWLRRTYSNDVLQQIKGRRVICSGTTLGGQPAMETYTRAMVHEFDRTNCKKCGYLHDQCFHNYLAHFNRLVGSNGGRISEVEVHRQGEGGIVNTVGLVSNRNNGASLKELGLVRLGTMEILDNDRRTKSAVIHMFDRDPEMRDWVQNEIKVELAKWNRTRNMSAYK